jgi:plastocyanin
VSAAHAADPAQPAYDRERSAFDQEYRKPPAPAQQPASRTPSPSDRERWKKRALRNQNALGIDKPEGAQPAKPAEPASSPRTGAAANEGLSAAGPTVVGRIIYRGAVPAPAQVEVTRDAEVCGAIATITALSVDSTTHGVRNAVVHIGMGEQALGEAPVEVAVVKNRRCAFYPRVAILRVGTEAEITNDDPIMHNTNMTIDSRTVLNVALVAGGSPIKKPLKKEGLHVLKCNVHKFMQAYRFVFGDPFFDQTNEGGQFRIAGLPPGLHTISVWHETLGTLQKEIQVPARGTVNVDLEFK